MHAVQAYAHCLPPDRLAPLLSPAGAARSLQAAADAPDLARHLLDLVADDALVDDASTGISVARGGSSAEDVFSVRLVLERSQALDIGYRIVTGYPSAP
jgi:hypothetical protein